MLCSLPAGLVAYFFLLIDPLTAFQLDLRATRRHSHWRSHLLPRAAPIALNNSGDIGYHTDIILGGQNFQVLVDTGSADLWVVGNVQQSNDTAVNASINYAIGKVEGPVKTARLELGDHIIENQTFLQITPSTKNQEGIGILGLGPSSGSFILSKLPSSPGAPVLDRLFLQDPSTPNYFTILLGRKRDPTTFFNGTITIGSVLPEYNRILNEPRLPITLVPQPDTHNQHFQVQLDEDGILGPDGHPIPLTSSTDGGKDRMTTVLDCGFTLPQVPRAVADSIYGRYKDAEYSAVKGIGGVWVLPCELEVNVTFVFGGKRHPMHPLDMTLDPGVFGLKNMTNSHGVPVCIGSFQPFTYDRGSTPAYDLVLGMAFMRNVYTLFDYGDFILGGNMSTSANKDPYVQMYSITNITEAHQDFVKVRLGGVDTTGEQGLLGKSDENRSPAVYYIVAGAAVVGVVVIAGLLTVRSRRKHRKGKDEGNIQR